MPCDGVKSGPALLRSRVVGLEDSQEVFSENLPDILLRVVSLQESLGDIKEQIGVAIAPARHGGAIDGTACPEAWSWGKRWA